MTSRVSKKVEIPSENDMKGDEELKPLSHYIDDRLELVKQIFSTLKPKTIKSLSPDFLKESTIEDIQEMCLNELLGISSKRLKSIIYASKCPTDTESSDSNVEENISLEEISSDSDGENQPKRKKGNKIGKLNKNKLENDSKNENGKEMSVLELLELQARARAIRSQLALEPIAKVELDDSEDSSKKDISSKSSDRKSNQSRTSKNHSIPSKSNSVSNSKTIATENSKYSKSGSAQSSNHVNLPSSKPIKLKRNYSKPSLECIPTNLTRNNHSENFTEKIRSSDNISRIPSVEKIRDVPEKIKKEVKDHKRRKDHNLERIERRSREKIEVKKSNEKRSGRSQSPDVLAILPSPEILSVSDSSDEENHPVIKKEKMDDLDSETDSSLTESSDTSLSSEESDSEYSNDDKNNPEKMEDLRNVIQRKKNKETEIKKPQSSTDVSSKDHKHSNESPQRMPNQQNNKINSEKNETSNEEIKEKSSFPVLQEKEIAYKDFADTNVSLGENSVLNVGKQPKDRLLLNMELEKSVIDCDICKVECERSLDTSNKRIKQDDDQHNDDAISLGDAELDYGIDHIVEERSNANINIPDTPLSPEVNQSEPEDNEECDNENLHEKSDFIDLHDSSGDEVCPEELME
ncbi:dentin sialophosphoprotein isoform X2 [Condylostylus longicornis]|uniref:dentin sialophosphoprotein isoform X2 n=1 Tax=Condylostylus longicornis TaxID=2530218 RepID=UPI00244E2261|nr:dentin sialophosphoprotein isoform X2 [Condylostylus longicornis]